MQPVNRLPPEILSHVAQYLIGDDEDDAISVVPLTHVCRYWRESIISTPEIWTLISDKNGNMTAVCLQRAKAAPLKITLRVPLDSSFHDIFAPYLQNTRTLAVHSMSTIEKLRSVFPNFPQSMPALRSLELIRSEDIAWDDTIDPFESFLPPFERLQLTGLPLYASLLKVGTLTEFTISNCWFDLHLDTLLDFLEGNHSLEKVTLDLFFSGTYLLKSRRKIAMKNQLRCLSINCCKDAKALITSIPLRRGADLHIHLEDEDLKLNDFLPEISAAHLSSPPSPTFFQLGHGPLTKHITLDGPSGKLSFFGLSEVSFADLTVLPLANVREVCLYYRKETTKTTHKPPAFYPSHFPALETLTVDCNVDVLPVLSVLLSNSPPSPSLKTIGFLNCELSQGFMEELTRFASERQNIPTSTRLHRIQIVHSDGVFPSIASVRKLRMYVRIVEVRAEDGFSMDLT